VIDPRKIRRVALLAARIKRLRINVDNEENLHELAEAAKLAGATIEVLVEININHNRTGVAPDEALPLARVAHELELAGAGVKFVGIAGYEGHTPVLPPADKTRETLASHAKLAAARRAIEDAGIAVGVVSGGGSSNYPDCLAAGIITELQAGGGALTDALYYHKANLANHGHRIGAFIVTQVIGVSNQGTHAMADAGFKSVGWHPFGGLPLVLDRPDLEVQGLSAEHLKLKPANPDLPIQLKRGDKVYTRTHLLLHRHMARASLTRWWCLARSAGRGSGILGCDLDAAPQHLRSAQRHRARRVAHPRRGLPRLGRHLGSSRKSIARSQPINPLPYLSAAQSIEGRAPHIE